MVVQCTWKPTDGRDIGDAVSWTSAEDGTPESEVEEEVQAENCLLLVAPTDGSSEFIAVPACQLLISCAPNEKIKYISILSDARVIEIYGNHGEYLKTIKNELIEEVEDMAVFKGDVQLDKAINVCSIKFACLRNKNEMWLYGVKVGIISAPNEATGSSISFKEVEKRLSEMDLSLSDKAMAFKDLVINEDFNAVINLFKGAALKELNVNDAQSVTNFQNQNCSTTINETNDNAANEQNNNNVVTYEDSMTQTMDPPPPSIEDIIKLHIDEKIEELEKQFSEKIEKSFKEIETKLMCKLEEIESFIKPHGVQNT